MIGARSGANLLLIMAGLLVWSSAFIALYAALSVGCAFGWDTRTIGPVDLQRAVLVAVWLLHLGLIGALLLFARRRVRNAEPDENARFLTRAALAATIVAAAVTLVNYAPILGLSTCL